MILNLHVAPCVLNEKLPKADCFLDVIGQQEAIRTLSFYVKSHSKELPVPTLLYSGSHGLGKTMMAKRLAMALDRHFVEVNCGKIKSARDFFDRVLFEVFEQMKSNGSKGVTILLDEAHAIDSNFKDVLLSLLNPNESNRNVIPDGEKNIIWDMTKINVVLASTDVYKIAAPLRNRCTDIYFYRYSVQEIVEILNLYLRDKESDSVKITCNHEDLAQVCRERARNTFLFSQDVKRFLFAKNGNKKIFDDNDLRQLKQTKGIGEFGLIRAELDLFRVICEMGPISAKNIAAQMMVDVKNIEEELEIRLRELGFIKNTHSGRIATELGKKTLLK